MTLGKIAHQAIQLGSARSETRFREVLAAPEKAQQERLRAILETVQPERKFASYSDFAGQFPPTTYADWAPRIAEQRAGKSTVHPDCRRFQPTSGSTDAIKWIPYSRHFLQELDAAVGPWLRSQARFAPGTLRGRHYWSLSWIPLEQRPLLHSSDDRDFFPLWKRLLWKATQAGDPSLAKAGTFEAARFATAVHLASASDLTFLSVWSPTFALSLFEYLSVERERVARALAGDLDKSDQRELEACAPLPLNRAVSRLLESWDGQLTPEFFGRLWPNLALVSAWDTSSSASWARSLQSLLPQAQFEGKGLWATEGVVTFPYEGHTPVAVTSHFYEWRDLETSQIVPTWELRAGQTVQPLLTTGSGLLRYALSDRLQVESFLEKTPCLKFLGRTTGVDMVGEKLSPDLATQALRTLEEKLSLRAVTLIASARDLQYRALIQGDLTPEQQRQGAELLEAELCRVFHYQLARRLGQLQAARLEVVADVLATLSQLARESGKIEGNLKVEPLLLEPARKEAP